MSRALGGGFFDLDPGQWLVATLLFWSVGFPIDVGPRALYAGAATMQKGIAT